jgi:hypothetical protein
MSGATPLHRDLKKITWEAGLNIWNRCMWLGVGTARKLFSTTTVWAHTRRKYFGQLGNYQSFEKNLGHDICSVNNSVPSVINQRYRNFWISYRYT